jgi:amino-acid N-acetyltransferase
MSPAGPVIGPVRHEELPAVLSLLERSRLPLDGVGEHLGSALVARHKGNVVGSAILELYGDSALLRSVAVRQAFRGRGLGARLTQAALDLARARGVRRAYLLTETAAEFFPRFGFRAISRERVPETVRTSVEFVSACPVGALVMEKELEPR